ncbi:uncharacterized protein LOC144622798 isoform X2 [Crassostrea virginica]
MWNKHALCRYFMAERCASSFDFPDQMQVIQVKSDPGHGKRKIPQKALSRRTVRSRIRQLSGQHADDMTDKQASTAVTNMEIQQNVALDRSSRCFVKMDYGPMRNWLNPAMTSSHRSMWNPSCWSGDDGETR